jgi:hypothetical protein
MAILKTKWMRFPFINFHDGKVEFYCGRRPASGGFGITLVFPGGSKGIW